MLEEQCTRVFSFRTTLCEPGGEQRCRQSRTLASHGPEGDDGHEDLQAGGTKVTTVTKIGKPGDPTVTTVTKSGKPRPHTRWQSRGLASRCPTSDDSHEDWQAGDPMVPTVTKISKQGAHKLRQSRGLKRRELNSDDCHEDWQAGEQR